VRAGRRAADPCQHRLRVLRAQGPVQESDLSDAEDLYGKSKYIGELHDLPHAITLRTSIIGHELGSSHALVDWFLSQQGSVRGFTQAIFSGLPTVELARVMKDFVLAHPQLNGLYHVAAEPIDKFRLLSLVAAQYGKSIEIRPDDALVIDRSLEGSRFRRPPAMWRRTGSSWCGVCTSSADSCEPGRLPAFSCSFRSFPERERAGSFSPRAAFTFRKVLCSTTRY